jgi:hypothetical protein
MGVAADFATIEVYTYTGEVKAVLDTDGRLDIAKIKADSSSLRLAAATRIEFDLDAVNIRGDGDGELRKDILDLHTGSVEAAIKGRAAVLRLFADVINGAKP